MASTPAPPGARHARLLAGRYEVGEQLAVGGTARVHAAFDRRLHRRVAVKLFDASLVDGAGPGSRERFVREARTAAQFHHPDAVSVFDAGDDDGRLFLVMELVDGSSLEARLRDGPLGVDEAVRVAEHVLAALGAAHARGIVHRDVKPANVLLGDHGAVKLADFGIAKRFDELTDTLTSTGFVVGTPRYLAPEQALGRPVGPATDVHAVGLLLFEMLTGTPAYAGQSAGESALATVTAPVPDVRTHRPDVPPHLAAVVRRALAKDPADRFPTAMAMAAALRRPAAGPTMQMPVVTVPAGARRRSPRWVLPAVLAVLALAAVTALALGRDDRALTTTAAPATSVAAPPTSVGAATTAPDASASTAAPATAPPATAPPATAPPDPTIVPGFPVTDDLAVFLDQLDDAPEVVGPAGPLLAEELREVLDKQGRRQREHADALVQSVDIWVGEGTLAPEIGAALTPLLADLSSAEDDRGDDDGDD